jgi:hypothetical protein
MLKRGVKQFWRPLIGVVVAYAVAAQSLLIVLGGFSLPARADAASPAFELCLHDRQNAPDLPAGIPGHPGCTHCVFCFAGAHHAVIGSQPVSFARAAIKITNAPAVADAHDLPGLSAYSIAIPRGPPLLG